MATAAATRFKLVFRVPASHLETCKTAVFAVGAGRYPGSGNYTQCCFTVMGTGQFRPGDTATPHIGIPGAVEQVQEASVETLCVGEDVARKAVEALKKYVFNGDLGGVRLFFCRRCFQSKVADIACLTELIPMRNLDMRSLSLRTSEWLTKDCVSHVGSWRDFLLSL